MTGILQLSALLLLGSALFNHKLIEQWLMNHKPMGWPIYLVMSFCTVAAVVWLLYGLGELL